MYTGLQAPHLIATVETLQRRIDERFPACSLSEVVQALLAIATEAEAKCDWIRRPHRWLRFGQTVLGAGLAAVLVLGVQQLRSLPAEFGFAEFVQMTDAGMNVLLCFGAALLFLFTFEGRVKRGRAIDALNELRNVAHIIDLHQLTKDPDRILDNIAHTPSSPRETMTRQELIRYLDYCSEMLSLVGKVAALYAQHLNDSEVVSTVNDIEDLTSGLSRKIWQKITILHWLGVQNPRK